ncbi:hypothetical protein IFM89_018239 [Coptis chinensis]|uniref:Uncharacterized protein n=1 Tax=Coptis chinensis TaxID=261450 RepID=A0A835M583_9MAGN|nr:hypothetical protein IFM89_018239 [Coptis chinensis]
MVGSSLLFADISKWVRRPVLDLTASHAELNLFTASDSRMMRMKERMRMEEYVMQFLAQKTVIYVTHQLEFLDASDLILVIKDGSIVQSGIYEDLIAYPYGELV